MSTHNEKENFNDLNYWCTFSVHHDHIKLSLFSYLVLSSIVHASQNTANVSKLKTAHNTQVILVNMSQHQILVQVPYKYAFSLNSKHSAETFISWSFVLGDYGIFKLIWYQRWMI